jgi:hypothetical protein
VLVLVLARLNCISTLGSGVFAVRSIPATAHSGAPTPPITIRSFDRRPAHTPYASRALPSELVLVKNQWPINVGFLSGRGRSDPAAGKACMAETAMPQEDGSHTLRGVTRDRKNAHRRPPSASGQFADPVHAPGNPCQQLTLGEDLDRLAIGLAFGGLSQLGDAQWLVGLA